MGTPQLNIKDAETTAMVRELAELTGESQTEVVRKAVKERLQRAKSERALTAEHRQRDRQAESDRILRNIRKLQADVRKRMKPEDFLTDDDLYDEWGLPK
jgi:antitoxin VapB